MKPYIFNGNSCITPEELVKKYIEDFDSGVYDIYKNTKKIYKFIRNTKNRETAKEFLRFLTYSKYKNNALTFVIFMFDNSDTKNVYICGKPMNFDDFLRSFQLYGNDKNNALYAFLEDHGISRTFAKLPYVEQKIIKDAYYIEKYYDNPFTFKYLTTYYNFSLTDSLNGKISSIAINGDECFRRATKITNDDNFKLAIAHKLGFKIAIEIANEVNPIFYTIKALRRMNETDEDLLRKLLDDTFYLWLLENLDKYQVIKKDAKETLKNLVQVGQVYKKYQLKVLHHELDDISLDLLCDLHREIYLNYLNFVTLYKNGSIIVKNKFSNELYGFTKPYSLTYITLSYMNGRTIKLYHPEEDTVKASFNKAKTKVISINPYTGKVDNTGIKIDPETGNVVDNNLKEEDVIKEVVDPNLEFANELLSENEKAFLNNENVTDDNINLRDMVDVRDINVEHNVENKTKLFKKLKGMAKFLMVLSLILLVSLFGLYALDKFSNGDITNKKHYFYLLSLGILAASLVFSVIYYSIVKSGIANLDKVVFVKDSKYKNMLTPEEEYVLYKEKKRGYKSYKVLKRQYIIISLIALMVFAVGVCALGICALNVDKIQSFVPRKIDKDIQYLVSLLAPAGIALLLGLIFVKKRNVLLSLIVLVLSVGVLGLSLFVL